MIKIISGLGGCRSWSEAPAGTPWEGWLCTRACPVILRQSSGYGKGGCFVFGVWSLSRRVSTRLLLSHTVQDTQLCELLQGRNTRCCPAVGRFSILSHGRPDVQYTCLVFWSEYLVETIDRHCKSVDEVSSEKACQKQIIRVLVWQMWATVPAFPL